MRTQWLRAQLLRTRLPESLARFLRHYFKEIMIALALAVVAAIIIDPILVQREKERKLQTLRNNLEAVATLQILDDNNKPAGQGSGFFITKTGILVTNYHVIKHASDVFAHLPSGAFYRLKGVKDANEKTDIAILQFDASDTPSVSGLGDSDQIEVGDEIYALGTPNGMEFSFSAGFISNKARQISDETFIQFTAPISPGSSGGGLFNKEGKVVGITAAMQTIQSGPQAGMAQNLNLAVPINDVKDVLHGGADELKRETPALFYSLGNLADNRKQWEKALSFYKNALLLDPNYTDAYVGLGGDFYETGNYRAEVDNYKKAAETDPGNAELFYYLGTAYEDTGEYNKAIQSYEKALSLEPNNKDTLHDLSILYLTMGDTGKALALLPKLRTVDAGWGGKIQMLSNRLKH